MADRRAGANDGLLAGAGSGAPILPPRLENAGLEDCALPPESIAEAFSLAAAAVSSRLARVPLSDSDDDEEDEGSPRAAGCVDDAGPARGAVPDVLVGGGGWDGSADKVVVGGRGEMKLGKEEGCVEGVGEGIAEPGRAQQGDGDDGEEEVVVAAEKAILLPDFA